jgi:hypothetical protein
MYFQSQAEYEPHYSPEARAARAARIRAEAEATIARALQLYNAGDTESAAAYLHEEGFEVDSWFAIWRA